MDVRTIIKGRSPSRQPTAGGSTNAALLQPVAHAGHINFNSAEIFKKPPCVADLKPDGRYVAKDIGEVTNIPPLLHTFVGFDADARPLNVKLTGVGVADRKTKWKPRTTNHTSGALREYAQQVGPALDGAVTRPGGAHEKQCYADI